MDDAGYDEIRPAVAHDADAIRKLLLSAFGAHVRAVGRKPAPMLMDVPATIARGDVHVLEDDRAVLGFVHLVQEADSLQVAEIAVAPETQGRGYGRTLMRWAEAEARARGLPAVTLYTNAAMTANLTFYPHLGFVETHRARQDGFDRVYYRKRI